YEGFYGDTTRLMLIENISNNQNLPVWRRFTYGGYFTFGDFDQDSLRDFVTANPGSSGEIYFFENTSDNQYERYCVDTVHLPNGIDVFSGNDLDGDGKPEFFVAFYSYGTSTFYLYMWEATGNNTYERTLVDQKTITVSYSTERKSQCGDIDGDGIEELVWTTPSQLFVYKATGNNQFQQCWQWYNDHGGEIPSTKINIYDMNNDGYKEIIVSGNGMTSIFEIEAVRLLRPNGGEVFQGNTQQLIRWQKFYPPRCDSLSLFYSIDNGINYSRIAHGISGNDTSYLWTVPSVNSDSCKIKVIAYGPGWQYDESDGVFSITSTGINEIASQPLAMTLGLKVYPNPAKSLSVIRYSLPVEEKVTIQLYNISGRLIKTLLDEYKQPGNYKLTLNTKPLSAGVYLLTLKTDGKRIIERLVVVK
ncbi:MAG: T9SS type A sorting domain-containing protein, partial [candidate division WOR-3 bacterium]